MAQRMVNHYVCTGYLTRDVQLNHTKGEQPVPVANMGIAVSRGQRGGEDLPPVFWEVACFGPQAEPCAKYLKKGSLVGIVAEVEPNSWQADDGSRRVQFKLNARTVTFLDRAPKDEVEKAQDSPAASQDAAGEGSNGSQAKRTSGRGRTRKDREPAGATA